MAAAIAENLIRMVPREKGNSCLVFWYIEDFSVCANNSYSISSPNFSVNSRSGVEWFLRFHFDMDSEPLFFGIDLKLAAAVQSDFRMACKINIVQHPSKKVLDQYGKRIFYKNVSELNDEVLCPQLIEKVVISRNPSKHLIGNALVIQFELNIEAAEEDPKFFDSAIHYGRFRDQDLIGSMMYNLYRERMFSDCSLIIQDMMVGIHTQLFKARSDELSSCVHYRIKDPMKIVKIENIEDEALLALLAYTYTGNPHDVGCTPINLHKYAERCGFPLLRYFVEPNIMTFTSRRKIQQMKLLIRIKNFFQDTSTKKNYIVHGFEIGDDFLSKWTLALDLRADESINFRLAKLFCPSHPFTIEFQTYALNISNRYDRLNIQTLQSDSSKPEAYSFAIDKIHLQGNHKYEMQHGLLNLKIVMLLFYTLTEHSKHFKMKFSSEICGADQTTPADFVQLRKDIFKMYMCPRRAPLNSRPDPLRYSKIITDVGEDRVHKFILALHSPYHKRLMEDYKNLYEIQMSSLSTPIWNSIIHFMYTGILGNLGLNDLTALLHAAKMYDLIYLRKECLSILRRSINLSNCNQIFKIAFHCNENELKAEALKVSRSRVRSDPIMFPRASTSREQNQVASPDLGAQFQDSAENIRHDLRSGDQAANPGPSVSQVESSCAPDIPLSSVEERNQAVSPRPSGSQVESSCAPDIPLSSVEERNQAGNPRPSGAQVESSCAPDIPLFSVEVQNQAAIPGSSTESRNLAEIPRIVKEDKDPEATNRE